MEDIKKRVTQKIEFYFQEKLKCHVDKFSGEWLNGYFVKQVTDGVWEFKEDKLGKINVFVVDISDVNDFREKEE